MSDELKQYVDDHKHLITSEIVDYVFTFLGSHGREFFREEVAEDESLISHHMFAGMQVRNALRDSGLCTDWDAHMYDNLWPEIVKRAISEEGEQVLL